MPVAFAFAVVPVFLSMLPLAMLGSALPVTGGNYIYPSRMEKLIKNDNWIPS